MTNQAIIAQANNGLYWLEMISNDGWQCFLAMLLSNDVDDSPSTKLTNDSLFRYTPTEATDYTAVWISTWGEFTVKNRSFNSLPVR